MLPHNIPDDINAELLFCYYPDGKCKAVFKGQHKRNVYSDIVDIEELTEDSMLLSIARDSIYNALPECMFHPIDRYSNLPKYEEKERFKQEYDLQEQEKENAYRFFAPLDLALLKIRIEARKKLFKYHETNKVLIDIITDTLDPALKENRFVKQVMPMLPVCKHIRGNKTLLTLMLRKVFAVEGLNVKVKMHEMEFCDENPRYEDGVDSELDSCYAGNVYDEKVTLYDIHFWSEDDCDAQFLTFVEEVEQFREFLQDYFMGIDDIIQFNIQEDAAPLRLNDDIIYNYLNYNTNI